MNEHGGVGSGLLMTFVAAVVFIALFFGACQVCFDHDDDRDDGRSLGPAVTQAAAT